MITFNPLSLILTEIHIFALSRSFATIRSGISNCRHKDNFSVDITVGLGIRGEEEEGHLRRLLSGPQPPPLLPRLPPLLLLLRLHHDGLLPPLLPLGDVEVEHPAPDPPVEHQDDGQHQHQQQDEEEGEDEAVLEGRQVGGEAYLLLVPGGANVGAGGTGARDWLPVAGKGRGVEV